MTGYLHSSYAASLGGYGLPIELCEAGGWLLSRQIPGVLDHDAMGSYPLFCCANWKCLGADLHSLSDSLVSVAVVADPFGSYTYADLCAAFDVVMPFKDHYVVQLPVDSASAGNRHHRYYTKRALRRVEVLVTDNPSIFLADWIRLYECLIMRHRMAGIRRLSPEALAIQFSVPGAVFIAARVEGKIVAGHVWYVQNNVAYSHLAASDGIGYQVGASYALYYSAIQFFAEHVQWLDLGAGAGLGIERMNGLAQFKAGWSTGTRRVYFCGKILQPERYRELARNCQNAKASYFPIYRAGEFA
jgi:hypothetical protein